MNIVDHIRETRDVTRDELESILTTNDKESIEYLRRAARAEADAIYGNKIFMRGLVELSSYCKNDCLYCGLRRSNKEAVRYRLTEEEIYEGCETGHSLGFRTFVLQGGEDAWFNDERMCRIVRTHCRWVSGAGRAIRHCMMLEPTAICCAMKPLMPNTMHGCTLPSCRGNTGWTACRP